MSQKTTAEPAYDLWENEGDEKVNSLRGRNRRGRVHYTPSVLPAVVLPSAGASYNPSIESYLEYASTIAKQEEKAKRDEEKTKRALETSNPPQPDAFHEDVDILFDAIVGNHADNGEQGADGGSGEIDIGGEDDTAVPTKPKTAKQRRAEAKRVRDEEKRQQLKETKRKKNELSQMKRITKEVKGIVEKQSRTRAVKNFRRAVKRLTTRHRLGRGKFEEYAEPVLLPDEITGSLRRIKPQGSIFEERLKSLQKRNMLPVAGDRPKQKLKAKLRMKEVEKREVKKIVKGSRVV